MLPLANDATFFTSQKLTLLAHGNAARLSQFTFSARKFDGEIDGLAKIMSGASPLILTNLLKSLVELSGIEPLTSTMPL